MKKQIKCEERVMFDVLICNTVHELIKGLQSISSNAKGTLIIRTKYCGYDGGVAVEIYDEFFREETDEEYQKRIKHETRKREVCAQRKLQQEQRDRKEFERLKKKFGEVA